MRHLLLILMLALLPMRGWAGDVMAIRMAGHQPVVVEKVASAPHAECAEHAHANAHPASGAHDAKTNGDCPSCAGCQVCSSVALFMQPSAVAVSRLPHGVPSMTGAAFTSAEPAPGFKPPIS